MCPPPLLYRLRSVSSSLHLSITAWTVLVWGLVRRERGRHLYGHLYGHHTPHHYQTRGHSTTWGTHLLHIYSILYFFWVWISCHYITYPPQTVRNELHITNQVMHLRPPPQIWHTTVTADIKTSNFTIVKVNNTSHELDQDHAHFSTLAVEHKHHHNLGAS